MNSVQPIREAAPITTANSVEFSYASLDEAFPKVDPGMVPLGACVLVQIRHPKRQSGKGVYVPDESRAIEHYNTQVAKVIALGALCFKSTRESFDPVTKEPKDVLVDWPTGPWFQPGNYVRVPKYGGDRFTRVVTHTVTEWDPSKRKDVEKTIAEEVIFAVFKANNVLGLIPDAQVLTHKSYID